MGMDNNPHPMGKEDWIEVRYRPGGEFRYEGKPDLVIVDRFAELMMVAAREKARADAVEQRKQQDWLSITISLLLFSFLLGGFTQVISRPAPTYQPTQGVTR